MIKLSHCKHKKLQLIVAGGFMLMSCFAQAQNLKIHYSLETEEEGATTVIDVSGNEYHGELKGSAKVGVFREENAIRMGTLRGYVDMGPEVGELVSSLQDYTVFCRFYLSSTTPLTYLWSFAQADTIADTPQGYAGFTFADMGYHVSTTGTVKEEALLSGLSKPNQAWRTLAVVQRGTKMRIYMDGSFVQQGDISLTPADLGNTICNYLGRSPLDGRSLSNANISDFRLYDGALSAAEIAELSGQAIGEEATLKLQYDFKTASDATGTYQGVLQSGATLTMRAGEPVLCLGNNNGYFEFGAGVGQVISQLEDFTIATNVYIPGSTILGANGNFIYCFSNSDNSGSDRNGYLYYGANANRYAISKTNYTAESAFQSGTAFETGGWKNLIYMQAAGEGRIYIDNKLIKAEKITLSPKDLGNTAYNYLGRSCYNGDVYLAGAEYNDFRIYDGILNINQMEELTAKPEILNTELYRREVENVKQSLVIENADKVMRDLSLPTVAGDRVAIVWTSSNEEIISSTGRVTRPALGSSPVKVTLAATITKMKVSDELVIEVTVWPKQDDADCVATDLDLLTLAGDLENLRSNIALPTNAQEGSVLSWSSSHPEFITNAGRLCKLSPAGAGKQTVTLTATAWKGDVRDTRDFEVQIAEDEGYSAYLFSYFTGNTQWGEQIRFAVSMDGYNYTPLNNGDPVISSDTIALKKGVRDPQILRGADGKTFYMVVTDMRSGEGWTSNRGMVLLKSTDLVNWTHSTVHFPERFPDTWSNVTRVWAPETVYDPAVGKYMVYFSLRTSDPGSYDKIYYAYANEDFTDLEHEPIYLYDRGSATIDGNIIYNEKDGLFHLFFKTEGTGGIQKVKAHTLTAEEDKEPGSQWFGQTENLQQTNVAVEGVGVFRLINSDTWVMMYDCYGSGYYQFCSSEDLENFTWIQNTATSGVFTPRHGTVLPITAEEAERLVQKWPSTSMSATPLGANNLSVKPTNVSINTSKKTIFLPVEFGTDLSSFDPQLYGITGTVVSPVGEQDFTRGAVNYTFSMEGKDPVTYSVEAEINANPVIPDFHADPEVLYSKKTGKFYIYPTTDGYPGWGGYSFNVFSSPDLVNWTDEGTFLDLSTDQVSWANGNAWAPCIEEKWIDGAYRYFFYYSGNAGSSKQIGVAISDSPTGPFTDFGKSIISKSPTGGGQQIDVDVFTDPVTGRSYIYWGNGYMAVAELNEDMVSLKEGTTKVITPSGGTLSDYAFREAPYVFYRDGLYYFLWSVDDTGSPNYHVAYGTSTSPMGPVQVAKEPIVLIQDAANQLYGTAHNSILQIPGRDEWYIVYHRINKHYLSNAPGVHREVCIDRLYFNEDGTIRRVIPTRQGITEPVDMTEYITSKEEIMQDNDYAQGLTVVETSYYSLSGVALGNQLPKKNGIYLKVDKLSNGSRRVSKRAVF